MYLIKIFDIDCIPRQVCINMSFDTSASKCLVSVLWTGHDTCISSVLDRLGGRNFALGSILKTSVPRTVHYSGTDHINGVCKGRKRALTV